jgi:hypothetical protein
MHYNRMARDTRTFLATLMTAGAAAALLFTPPQVQAQSQAKPVDAAPAPAPRRTFVKPADAGSTWTSTGLPDEKSCPPSSGAAALAGGGVAGAAGLALACEGQDPKAASRIRTSAATNDRSRRDGRPTVDLPRS